MTTKADHQLHRTLSSLSVVQADHGPPTAGHSQAHLEPPALQATAVLPARHCCTPSVQDLTWALHLLLQHTPNYAFSAASWPKFMGSACSCLVASKALCIATALRAAAATKRSACSTSGAVGSAGRRWQESRQVMNAAMSDTGICQVSVECMQKCHRQ